MTTLTIADLDNGKRDLQTVDGVANSRAASVPTRYGRQTTTLYEAIRRINAKGNEVIRSLGYFVPVDYAPGLNVTEPNFTVVGPDGKIYAAQAGQLPFTSGAWNPDQWYPIQNDLNDRKLLVFGSLVEAEAAAATLPDGQELIAPDSDGEVFSYRVSGGGLTDKIIFKPKKTLRDFGAVGDGVTDDSVALAATISASAGKFAVDGEGLTYKVTSPVNFLPFSEFSGVSLDLTSLSSGVGVTHRVGSKFTGNRYTFSAEFSGTGVLFTTVDNASSTSVSNLDTNTYVCEDLVVEKKMPTSGVAWDWYTGASGLAVDWFGEDNPDPVLTSGFWGGWMRGLTVKGVWMQSGRVRDDGVGWITSCAWQHVVVDGPRRGLQVDGAKTGNINFDDVHMQGWRWTKDGQPDVVTEWMVDAPRAAYCRFSGLQPQDFDAAFGITEYVRLGAGSRDCYVESNYITTDQWLKNDGTRNYWKTNFGISFTNQRHSAHPRTLDHYEEGVFTPELNCADMTFSYTTQKGFFTRIGNLVSFDIQIQVASSTGAGLGVVNIRGLPYVSRSDSGFASAASIAYLQNVTIPAGRELKAYVGAQATSISLQHVAPSSNPVPVSGVQLSTSRIILSGTYKTAS